MMFKMGIWCEACRGKSDSHRSRGLLCVIGLFSWWKSRYLHGCGASLTQVSEPHVARTLIYSQYPCILSPIYQDVVGYRDIRRSILPALA